ncbi:MAG: ATP-binding protein, partial [Acidobacteriota bacterium]|nr:ATP-binding protein [Acidobacteriota bacterium]
LDKKAVMELFDLTFLPKHENVVFLGPPGIGKTHLAVALAIKACSHGFKVYFTTMSTLIGKLKEPQSKGKAFLSAILDRLLHHSRVINIKGHSYRLKDHGFRQPSYPKEGGETVSATPA